MQVYLGEDVLTAARERIESIFEAFESIVVNVSGGKDSTVLAHLVLSQAKKLNRKVTVFFLDEEVVYQSTIDQIEYLLFEMFPEVAIPVWWQIELNLSNGTSLTSGRCVCWQEGAEWLRPKDERAVHTYPYKDKPMRNKQHGFGILDALKSFNDHHSDTCFLIGLRADENITRFRAVTRHAGYKNWLWTTAQKHGNILAYPLYDWRFSDVWRYIADNNLTYNKIYDYMWFKGLNVCEFRISNLIHAKACRSLVELPEFEPDTYNKVANKIASVEAGNLYGKEKLGFKVQQLPKNFGSWLEYRNFLLLTYPDREKVKIFVERFSEQASDENAARQQCRQLILNDIKNRFPTKPNRKERVVERWKNLL